MSTSNPTSVHLRPSGAKILLALTCVLTGLTASRADFQGSTHMMPFDEDTIAYSKTPATDPVAQLQRKIDAGDVKLAFDGTNGYLRAVLEGLKVPLSSQMLVFSKTSLQRERISPRTPRAVYFGDAAYVGFVAGSPLLEIATVDQKLGGVFYTLEQKSVERPRFIRNDQCLECHASAKTMGVPGHLVRSFATDESGIIDLATGTSLVNHRTPLEDRWGGWYVTGEHGSQTHRGNLIGKEAFERHAREPNLLGNLQDLSRFFDVTRYPLHQSDIVALMIMEHQAHMHNFITRLNYESTLALQQYGHINYLKNTVNAFLKYMLFTEEAPLTSPIRGSAEFARQFSAQGPRDRQGRSLRDLDLQTRMFKYPFSFLVYSEAFDGIAKPVKEHIYQRLGEILSGKDTRADFSGIPPETKRAVMEILRETKPDIAEYWKRNTGQPAQNAEGPGRSPHVPVR